MSGPVDDLQPRNPLKVCEVVGHQGGVEAQGMGGNQQVHRPNRFALLFQLLPDAAVVRRTTHRVVVVDLKGQQDLLHRRALVFVAAAIRGRELQSRYRDRRDPDLMTFLLSLPAPPDQLGGALAPRLLALACLEPADEEDQGVGVQQVDHSCHWRCSSSGWTRPDRKKSSESSSTPSKKTSQGSRGMTRNPSRVRLRYTSGTSTRNSLGSRMAWLRPLVNTFATVINDPLQEWSMPNDRPHEKRLSRGKFPTPQVRRVTASAARKDSFVSLVRFIGWIVNREHGQIPFPSRAASSILDDGSDRDPGPRVGDSSASTVAEVLRWATQLRDVFRPSARSCCLPCSFSWAGGCGTFPGRRPLRPGPPRPIHPPGRGPPVSCTNDAARVVTGRTAQGTRSANAASRSRTSPAESGKRGGATRSC